MCSESKNAKWELETSFYIRYLVHHKFYRESSCLMCPSGNQTLYGSNNIFIDFIYAPNNQV